MAALVSTTAAELQSYMETHKGSLKKASQKVGNQWLEKLMQHQKELLSGYSKKLPLEDSKKLLILVAGIIKNVQGLMGFLVKERIEKASGTSEA